MAAVSFFGKFFGRTVSEAAAYGAGLATGPVLRPVTRAVESEVWKVHPDMPIDPETAAAIVAEDVERMSWGADEASSNGVNGDRFGALVGEALNAPGIGELFALWRRDAIGDTDFLHGLRKAKLEGRWDGPLQTLKTVRLSPDDVATMVQRSVLPNPGILPVTFDNAGSNVTPMPQVDIDPFTEAAAAGYDRPRLEALARIVGLPPAPGELLQLLNRGTINESAFRQGISEGNTRNEWADALMSLRRRILTPHEYAELYIRGWISKQERDAGAALSGMQPADTQLLSDVIGRPLAVHQVTTGLARGGSFGGNYEGVPEPYLTALRQSNVRPEWGNLAYANRYSLPSFFVLRALIQDGTLTAEQGGEYFKQEGWPPALADAAAQAYAGGTTAKGDPHVSKAQTQLWTTTHRSYVAEESDDTAASAALNAAGVATASIPAVLSLWQSERDLIRKQLSPSQIRKAIGGAVTNPATGQPWTRAEGIAAMLARGYTQADAETFLDEG